MDYTSKLCTNCGASMAPIIYGFPTPQMVEAARDDLIALGGIKPGPATHYCYNCQEVE